MSEPIKDGGPAFPDDRSQVGMSLRDYFAGQALAGIMAGSVRGHLTAYYAKDAYDLADKMLAVREVSHV